MLFLLLELMLAETATSLSQIYEAVGEEGSDSARERRNQCPGFGGNFWGLRMGIGWEFSNFLQKNFSAFRGTPSRMGIGWEFSNFLQKNFSAFRGTWELDGNLDRNKGN